METADIVKVAVSAAPYSIDKPYDYLVPEDCRETALPGSRVLVPFGPTGTQRKGQIREVLRCLPENATWPPQLTKTVLARADAPGQ